MFISPSKALALIMEWKTLRSALTSTMQNYIVAGVFSFIFIYLTPTVIRDCLFNVIGLLFMMHYAQVVIDDLKPRTKVTSIGKAIFITGCDTGFGHILALDLKQAGFRVFAGCLLPNGEGAENLKRKSISVIPLDVTSDESVSKAFQYVTENLGNYKLWAVVNNAGIVKCGETWHLGLNTFKEVLDVNTFGVVRVTKVFLPLLRKSGGRVVTVNSMASQFALPYMPSYNMSKSATSAFCETLRREIFEMNVKVITVEPCYYRTTLLDNYGNWQESDESSKSLNFSDDSVDIKKKFWRIVRFVGIGNRPHDVTDAIKEAVTAENPKLLYTVASWRTKIYLWLVKMSPKSLADSAITIVLHGFIK